MKLFGVLVLLCKIAWPQVETGTVVVYVLSQNAITVAADSREIDAVTERHNDMSCKIRAFSNGFFFSMAGPVGGVKDANGLQWSAFNDARNAWLEAEKLEMVSSAQKMTDAAAEQWNKSIKKHLNNYAVMKPIRNTLQGNSVASALFGSVDTTGNLAVTRVNIAIDLGLFDNKKIVELSSEIVGRSKLQDGGTLVLGEIANQYVQRVTTTERQRRDLSPNEQDAEIARKLVELSIDLHPRQKMLGRPVDELRLDTKAGIAWLSLKDNCKKQD